MIMVANVHYARLTGWIYLLLAVAGLFERHIFYILTLPVLTTLLYLMIGLTGLTTAHKASKRGLMVYTLSMGIILSLWGLVGTVQPGLFMPAPLPIDNALHLLTGLWAFYGLLNEFWVFLTAKLKKEGTN